LKTRLQTETRRTVEELYIINDMSGALSSATNLQELLAVIDAQLPSLTDAQMIYVAIYDPKPTGSASRWQPPCRPIARWTRRRSRWVKTNFR
jgi:hypothetical protein